MKRILSFCLMALLLLSLASCGYDDMNGKALPSASLLRRSANDFIQNVSNEGFTLRVKEYRTFLQTGENTHTYEKDTATLYVTAKDGKAYLKAEDGDDLYEEWYADGYLYEHTSTTTNGKTIETKEKYHSTWDKEFIRLKQQGKLIPALSDDELATATVDRDGAKYTCTYQMDPALHSSILIDTDAVEELLGSYSVYKFEYIQVFNYDYDLVETIIHLVITTTEQEVPVTIQVKIVTDWTQYYYPEDVEMPEKMRGYTLVETTPDDNVGADE